MGAARVGQAGVECLRIEAGMYDKNKTREITRAYREAMDKRRGRGCEGEYTTGHYFRGWCEDEITKWLLSESIKLI